MSTEIKEESKSGFYLGSAYTAVCLLYQCAGYFAVSLGEPRSFTSPSDQRPHRRIASEGRLFLQKLHFPSSPVARIMLKLLSRVPELLYKEKANRQIIEIHLLSRQARGQLNFCDFNKTKTIN